MANLLTWGIAAAATAGVILRPLRIPEAAWAVAGAIAVVALGLLPPADALRGIEKGTDVYLFLAGMMLLAEIARAEGLFDWLAAHAAAFARGSAVRLFTLIYAVGIAVTVFLSNDATAVVLTPAVAAVTRTARVERPLPYLLACALIANAASFVLPISNPANLVIFATRMPPLFEWLPRFLVPSIVSILVTYVALRWTDRSEIAGPVASNIEAPRLGIGGRIAAAGIGAAACLLLVASARGWQLGRPTLAAGVGSLILTCLVSRTSPRRFLRDISWGVLPLVAGLFVLVQSLEHAGLTAALSGLLQRTSRVSVGATALAAGLVTGFGSNLVNNLPAGLIAGSAVQSASVPDVVSSAVLLGIDLGPNLSVTGSLATILWLAALRRDGIEISAWRFLRVGLIVMPPALLASLGWLLLRRSV
jgi:arsenical pump membrane protein